MKISRENRRERGKRHAKAARVPSQLLCALRPSLFTQPTKATQRSVRKHTFAAINKGTSDMTTRRDAGLRRAESSKGALRLKACSRPRCFFHFWCVESRVVEERARDFLHWLRIYPNTRAIRLRRVANKAIRFTVLPFYRA